MKKQNRFLTTLCILIAFTLLLGACSKAEPSSTGNDSSAASAVPTASEEVEASPEAPVALDTARTVSVLELTGKVTVKSNGQDVDAFQGMRLRQGDVITTDAGAAVHLDLDSDKLVTLDESSSISLDVLSGDAKNQTTTLTLLAGTACNSISKLSGASSYDVKTANFTMGVRGTIFVVRLDSTGKPEVSVVEGKVEAKPDTASEDGMLIGAQQSANPTPELWNAFLADPAAPVTRPLDMATLSDPILSTIIVELEQRAQALPEQTAALTKIADAIKAARPEAATAADSLKQQLKTARETLGLPVSAVATPAPPAAKPAPAAQTPPVTSPVPPKADNPDRNDGNDKYDDDDDDGSNGGGNKPNKPDEPNKPVEPEGGGGTGGKPIPPKPVPLSTPVVTVQDFTKDGFNISFAPVANAVSYSISVNRPSGGFIYSHSMPAPAGTSTIIFAHTFDTPLQYSGLYTLRVTALASTAENNSNAFIHAQTIIIPVSNFEVIAASLNYKSTSFDILSYPQGANGFDVLVRNTATNDVYLEATGTHAHFESDLDIAIDATGEYELVITPKRAGDDDDDDDDNHRHQNNQFAPYRLNVQMTKISSPAIQNFDSIITQLQLSANLAQFPTPGSTYTLEAEFYKDGAKIENDASWNISSQANSSGPHSFIVTYKVNSAPAAIPNGNYTAKIRTIDTANGGIPSDWVDTDSPISIP